MVVHPPPPPGENPETGLAALVQLCAEVVCQQRARSPHWIKVKNRKHHAIDRVTEAFSRKVYKVRGCRRPKISASPAHPSRVGIRAGPLRASIGSEPALLAAPKVVYS
jgi:hypothetical protein